MTFEKEKESGLKQSIKDKNIMLAEVHHRVKNNLQIINSLISLKSRKIEDQYTLDIIKEIENRIKSMGLIHEQLYQQETFSTIDIQKYVKAITSQIKGSFMDKNIKFEIDVHSYLLDLDTLTPLGLLITEIITNSLKYAFPNGQVGVIKIDLREFETTNYKLVISDNGIGFDLNNHNGGVIGMELIQGLVMQLGGTHEIESDNGTKISVIFPIPLKN